MDQFKWLDNRITDELIIPKSMQGSQGSPRPQLGMAFSMVTEASLDPNAAGVENCMKADMVD